MKRFAFILAIVLLLAGCGSTQVAEAPENLAESYPINHSLDEVEVPDEIAVRVPVEPPQDIRPHHYGSFNEVVYYHGTRLFYFTEFEEFEFAVPNIVRGRMLDDARMLIGRNDRPIANIVSFEILEVFKGDLIPGESIRIMEPYFIEYDVLFTRGNYMPSTPYQDYIFFLSAVSTSPAATGEAVGSFWVFHSERGRFPVPASGQDLDEIDLALGSHANVEVYMRLWQEVVDAFIH